jgi:hypothetical protein
MIACGAAAKSMRVAELNLWAIDRAEVRARNKRESSCVLPDASEWTARGTTTKDLPMRSKLLISTAALLAGIAMASAQNMPGGGASQSPGGAATPSQPQGSPSQRGPDKQGQAQQGQKEQGQTQRGQKGETTGQAPQGKEQGKDEKGPTQRGQKGETTGQAPQGQTQPKAQGKEERGQGQPSTQSQPGGQAPTQGQAPQRQQGQQGQTGQAPQGQAPQGQAQQGQQGQAGGSVTLTTEQRTKIRQTVLVGGAPRVSSVNFTLSVGTVVPTSVRVVEVHPVLVEIHPEWRGFMYFVVGDQIIIVDRNHHIVAIVAV